MPKDGYFFDTIVRQEPIDDDHLNPEDNLEEFQAITPEEVEEIAADLRDVGRSGRAVMATLGGTAFGDIALVPAPFLKKPKGIRDISEWYLSTRARRGYIHQVFSRQCEIALGNLAGIHAVAGDTIDTVFVCGTDFGTQTSSFCSEATFRDLYYPYYKQVNDWIHRHTRLEDLQAFLRVGAAVHSGDDRGRLRHSESGAVLGHRHGRSGTQAGVWRPPRVLGRWNRHAEGAAVRDSG